MTPIIDLNLKKKDEDKEDEHEDIVLGIFGAITMVAFSLFIVYMFFTGLCGGKFW